jgi:hypothetical protein
MEKSGHLYARCTKEGFEEYLKGKYQEISFSQTAHIVEMRKTFSSDLGNLKYIAYTYDKVKIFSFPLKDQIVVLSAECSANTENIIEKTLEYINTMGAKLSLYPPSNVINEEKKEMLRNLLESEIPEEMIAERLICFLSGYEQIVHISSIVIELIWIVFLYYIDTFTPSYSSHGYFPVNVACHEFATTTLCLSMKLQPKKSAPSCPSPVAWLDANRFDICSISFS